MFPPPYFQAEGMIKESLGFFICTKKEKEGKNKRLSGFVLSEVVSQLIYIREGKG